MNILPSFTQSDFLLMQKEKFSFPFNESTVTRGCF